MADQKTRAVIKNQTRMTTKPGCHGEPKAAARTYVKNPAERYRFLSYKSKRQKPCREDGHSQPISIITTLVSILRMYCVHAKDIITAFCFYPLEGRLDRPKYPGNTQSLLSLHAARRVAKTVNKKDSLSYSSLAASLGFCLASLSSLQKSKVICNATQTQELYRKP